MRARVLIDEKASYARAMGNTQKAANRLGAIAAAKKQTIATKARATIALIVAKKDEIARDFYTIGRALVALDDKAVIAALGHKSFAALCDVELRMSAAQAARLMNVVKSFSERDAERLTAAKATAIIDLAGAMGGKTTAKGLLSRGTVHVPGVGPVDVHGADAAVIARAARSARAKSPAKRTHGVSLSTADAALVTHLRAGLRRAKVKSATVEGIASSAVTGGRFRVTGYLHDARAIGEALSKIGKTK